MSNSARWIIYFEQCFRRWAEEKDFVHLANAGKYLSAMVAVALKITYSKNSSVGLLVTFFIASTIATIYQVYWDTFVDWGLLRRDSKNRWLRDELLLKRKWIYFASMVLHCSLSLCFKLQKNIEFYATGAKLEFLQCIRSALSPVLNIPSISLTLGCYPQDC